MQHMNIGAYIDIFLDKFDEILFFILEKYGKKNAYVLCYSPNLTHNICITFIHCIIIKNQICKDVMPMCVNFPCNRYTP